MRANSNGGRAVGAIGKPMTQEVRTMRGFVVLVVDDDTDNL